MFIFLQASALTPMTDDNMWILKPKSGGPCDGEQMFGGKHHRTPMLQEIKVKRTISVIFSSKEMLQFFPLPSSPTSPFTRPGDQPILFNSGIELSFNVVKGLVGLRGKSKSYKLLNGCTFHFLL